MQFVVLRDNIGLCLPRAYYPSGAPQSDYRVVKINNARDRLEDDELPQQTQTDVKQSSEFPVKSDFEFLADFPFIGSHIQRNNLTWFANVVDSNTSVDTDKSKFEHVPKLPLLGALANYKTLAQLTNATQNTNLSGDEFEHIPKFPLLGALSVRKSLAQLLNHTSQTSLSENEFEYVSSFPLIGSLLNNHELQYVDQVHRPGSRNQTITYFPSFPLIGLFS